MFQWSELGASALWESVVTTTDDELEAFLVSLEIMSLAALQAEWQTRWERPPVLRSPRLLRHLIAWRIGLH